MTSDIMPATASRLNVSQSNYQTSMRSLPKKNSASLVAITDEERMERKRKRKQLLQQKKDPTHFRALRGQIRASAFNLKKVICGQGVLSLEDTKPKTSVNQSGGSNLPIFNQPELRQDLETYLDIVMDYTQQTK